MTKDEDREQIEKKQIYNYQFNTIDDVEEQR